MNWITNLSAWTGHLALTVTLVNRLQATALDYRLLRVIKLLLFCSLPLAGLVPDIERTSQLVAEISRLKAGDD